MSSKVINTRIINKHETEANWSKAENFIPKQGEIIIYDIDENHEYERIKIGDGIKNVNNLPFSLDMAEGGLGQETNEGGEIFNDYTNNIAGIKGYRINSIEPKPATDGMYVRIRNSGDVDTIYTCTITSKSIKALGLNEDIIDFIARSNNVTIYAQENTMIDGEVTFKVKLPANGGYAQFNQKLTDLIDGGARINIKIGENTDNDYINARLQVQLTADAEAATDIVPVDERYNDPGVNGMTWLFYGNNQRLWTGRGNTTGNGGTYSNPVTDVSGKGGINIIFKFNNDSKQVYYESTDTLNGFSNNLPSTKALSEIVDPYGKALWLNDKTLADQAWNHYEIGDIVNIDSASHYYSTFKIHGINKNRILKSDGSVIYDTSLMIYKIDNTKITENINLDDGGSNWVYVVGKSFGEPVTETFYAHTEGLNNKAIGLGSHAEGKDSQAIGNHAHAEGRATLAHYAAHAEGRETQALGMTSHAEGHKSIAQGKHAHAEGLNTRSWGQAAHAEGKETHADGENAHSEGLTTYATGSNSHAEGTTTYAEALNTHSEGQETHAIGINSHAEGYKSKSIGECSHAEGSHAHAMDVASHAEGSSTQATADSAHAEGKETYATGAYSHSEGKGTVADSRASHAEGEGTKASATAAHAEGVLTEATGSYSHAEGWKTQATNRSAHAEGTGTVASGADAHAEGSGTKAIGAYAHSEGDRSEASGGISHAEGYNTVASGESSHAEGSSTTASGYVSHAEGHLTLASGQYSHASGFGTNAKESCQTAIGIYNSDNQDALFMVGNGTDGTHAGRSNAFTVYKNGYAELEQQGITPNSVVTNSKFRFYTSENDIPTDLPEGTLIFIYE